LPVSEEMTGKDGGTSGAELGRLPFAVGACFALSAAMLTTFPIVSPDVVSELRLSYAQTGVIAAAYLFGYGLFQLPASLLGVRLGSGRVLIGATVLMSMSSLVPYFVASYPGWVVSRLLMGIGGAAVLPLSIHLLTRAMSGPRLVRGLAVFVSGWGIGMSLAMVGAAPLLHAVGWRQVMLMSAVLGIAVIASLKWALPARLSGRDADACDPPNLAAMARRLSGNPALNLMGLVNAAGTTIMVCIPAWLPLYLTGTFGVSAAETSASLSPIGVAIAVGAWAGGALSIRLGWRLVVVSSLVASCLLAVLIPLQSSAAFVVGIAILIGLVGMLFPAPIQSLFPSVVPEEWTALAAGYYNTIGFIGAFSASLVFGCLVDWFGSFTVGWLWLASIPVVGIAAALSLRLHGWHAPAMNSDEG
jgi:predicted MFS family arabinose efflux permease